MPSVEPALQACGGNGAPCWRQLLAREPQVSPRWSRRIILWLGPCNGPRALGSGSAGSTCHRVTWRHAIRLFFCAGAVPSRHNLDVRAVCPDLCGLRVERRLLWSQPSRKAGRKLRRRRAPQGPPRNSGCLGGPTQSGGRSPPHSPTATRGLRNAQWSRQLARVPWASWSPREVLRQDRAARACRGTSAVVCTG